MWRTVAVVGCTVLLCLTLFGANAVLAVDRGPLDPEHASESLADAGAYDLVEAEAVAALSAEISDDDLSAFDLTEEELLAEIITTAWIQGETERNAEHVLAYLRGEDELAVTLDLGELAADSRPVIEAEMANLSYAELGYERVDTLLADEESFESERAAIRRDVLAELDMDPDDGFGEPVLRRMIEGEESYEAEREALQREVAQELLADADADAGFGHERIATLLEDEASYETEQREFRDARKEEIQEETEEELSDEELDEAYEERVDEFVEEGTDAVVADLTFEDLPEDVDPPAEEIADATARALATDLTYQEYRAEYDAAVNDFEDDLVAHIATSGDEYHDEIRNAAEVEPDDDAPDPVVAEIDAMETLVIDAVTTELPYDTFLAEYEEIAARIEEEGAAYAWEHRDEYEAEIDEAIAAEVRDEDLPEPIADEMDAFSDLGQEAILTDMTYAEFVDEVEVVESALVDALVAYVFESEGLDEEIDVSEELEEAAGEELAMARQVVSALGLVLVGLVGLAGVLTGGIYVTTRDLAVTGIAVGVATSLVGGVSYAGATILPGMIVDMLGGEVEAGVRDVLGDLLGFLLAPWATQSLVLFVGGVVVLGVGMAVNRGYLDLAAWRGADDGAPDEPDDKEDA